MAGSNDILRKLDSLGRTDDEFLGGGRVISRGGNPTPLQAIVNEIDETVLTRDLTFQFGQAGSLVLVVSGRRLLGVRAVKDLALPMIASQLAGQQIKGENDPHLRALTGVLLPLDLLNETVTVQSTSVEWGGPVTGTGVSVEKIAARLSIQYPFEPLTRLGQFKANLIEIIDASVHRLPSGTETTEGSDADLDWLFANAVPLLAAAKSETPVTRATTLGDSAPGGRTLSVAFDGGESMIWVHDSQHLAEIAREWHKIASSAAVPPKE